MVNYPQLGNIMLLERSSRLHLWATCIYIRTQLGRWSNFRETFVTLVLRSVVSIDRVVTNKTWNEPRADEEI